MQSFVEKRELTGRVWWRGCLILGLAALMIAAATQVVAGAAFFGGGMSLVVGSWVSARFSFRDVAPSGSAALVGIFTGVVLKWMVVGVMLTLSMIASSANAPWVLAGLVFAQAMLFVVVLTFKRQ